MAQATPPFLVLSANTPWVFALADALSARGAATAMRFYDVVGWRRERPSWPRGANAALRKVLRVLPPGYAGRLEPLFRPLLRGMIDRERRRLRRAGGGEPFVIAPYPYLEPWLAHVPDDRLIYYSLDEYAFYDPPRAARIHALEDRLVARAALTMCLSHYQAEVLRARHPARAADIRHVPLGVERAFLNPDPAAPPRAATVGYVGNLGDRVDWAFVAAVAERAPELRFEFVGSLGESTGGTSLPDWEARRRAALALGNVAHLGSVAQAEVAPFYWRSAVNWMPYDIRHGFNLAACPTKIMDALAAGRPFASTGVPECRLYPDLVHVRDDPAEMAALLRDLIDRPRPDAATMVDHARHQLWPDRAETLIGLLAAGADGRMRKTA